MSDSTPVVEKEPWWKWVVEDPKKAVRLVFFVLALVGYDQWAASRVSEVKNAVSDAALKSDHNAKTVEDLFKVVSDVKFIVGSVQAKQDEVLFKSVAPKPSECTCGKK